MWCDLILQAVLIIVSVVMFLAMYDVPQKYLTKLRYRNRADLKAKGHFVTGAQLLSKARSASSRSASASLARDATTEADKAIALDPRDAASHILKALALDLQGFKTSALDSLEVALSPLAVKSLGAQEKGDALYKRAELKVALSRRGKVDSAVDDLTQAVKLSAKSNPNPKVYLLLGECYEVKNMKEEAAAAYGQVLKINPAITEAREALSRLGTAL